jgi:Family of unknown function (DUF6161)
MELEGPVDYWTAKHKEHKKAALKWGIALVSFAFLGTGALGILFYYVYTHAYDLAVTGETKFNHLVVLMSGAALAASTVVLWVGRFLQKLYISERHMAIDAKLRVTMAKT